MPPSTTSKVTRPRLLPYAPRPNMPPTMNCTRQKFRMQGSSTAADPTKYILTCPRGGKKFFSRAIHRDSSSVKAGVDCPWRAKAVKMKRFNDHWVYLVGDQPYSHPPDKVTALACHRNLDDGQKQYLFSLFERNIKATTLLTMIQDKYKGSQLTAQDIYNYKKIWKQQPQGPYTATQAWIRELQSMDTPFVPCYQDGRVKAVFWTH